jgi:hypothetical protein
LFVPHFEHEYQLASQITGAAHRGRMSAIAQSRLQIQSVEFAGTHRKEHSERITRDSGNGQSGEGGRMHQ